MSLISYLKNNNIIIFNEGKKLYLNKQAFIKSYENSVYVVKVSDKPDRSFTATVRDLTDGRTGISCNCSMYAKQTDKQPCKHIVAAFFETGIIAEEGGSLNGRPSDAAAVSLIRRFAGMANSADTGAGAVLIPTFNIYRSINFSYNNRKKLYTYLTYQVGENKAGGGKNKKFVVKKLDEFTDAFKHGEKIEYSPTFSAVHDYIHFSRDSAPDLDLLLNNRNTANHTLCAEITSVSSYNGYYSNPDSNDKRRFYLNAANTDQFFRSKAGKRVDVVFQCDAHGKSSRETVKDVYIEEKNYPLDIKVTETAGGFNVSFDSFAQICVYGAEHLIIFPADKAEIQHKINMAQFRYETELKDYAEREKHPALMNRHYNGRFTAPKPPEQGIHNFVPARKACLCDKEYSRALREIFLQIDRHTEKRSNDAGTSGDNGNGSIFVSAADMTAFLNNVTSHIGKHVNISLPRKAEEFIPPPLQTSVYFDRYENAESTGAKARMTFTYGDNTHSAFREKDLSKSHDLAGEIRAENLLIKYMGDKFAESEQTERELITCDNDALYALATKGVDEIMKCAVVYASDEFNKIQLRRGVTAAVGVRVNGGLLDFNFELDGVDYSELADVLHSFRRAKKYHRFRDGSFLNLEDGALKSISEIAEGLDLTDKELAKGHAKFALNRAFYLDNTLKETLDIPFDRDRRFKQMIRDFHESADADYEVPPTLKRVLRGYQKNGYRWLRTLEQFNFGGILADDMGLGKTLQVLALLLSRKLEYSDTADGNPDISLVVCPASLALNWEAEARKFTPQLRVLALCGSAYERQIQLEPIVHSGKIVSKPTDDDGEPVYDLVITSYDYLKRDIELYQNTVFRYVIIDEAQYIKNQNTQNAKAVKAVNAQVRFALTGTPIENSLAELWSIFDFLMAGYLHNYTHFKKKYETPIVKNGDTAALERLRSLVRPFMIRRLKSNVLKELPEKTESIHNIKMEEAQSKLYLANMAQLKCDLTENTAAMTDAQAQVAILAALTRLRRICCDPGLEYENYTGGSAKTDAALTLVESAVEAGHRVLLFSQFTTMLDILEKKLTESGISHCRLDGSTPVQKRLAMTEEFNGGSTGVFLISLKAGGTGLNLTGADMVIHYDPWWNLSAQNQATDRAHRIGQTNKVQVYKLILKGTIEEKILALQERKADLADSIIQKGGDAFSKLSKDELLGLFDN